MDEMDKICTKNTIHHKPHKLVDWMDENWIVGALGLGWVIWYWLGRRELWEFDVLKLTLSVSNILLR